MPDRSDEILLQLLELRKELGSTVIQQIVKVYETLAPVLEQARQESLQKIDTLDRKLHVVNQSVALTARLALRHKRKTTRCVFLIHMAEAWDALAPVYEAMRSATDFEPIVISIPRMLPAEEGGLNEEKTHLELERFGVPHLRFSMSPQGGLDILKALQPDILFRQQPWDKLLPDAYDTTNLTFTRLCYVPYGYMAVKRFAVDEVGIDANGSPRHTDQFFHRMCWRIFCETEMHREMHERVGARRGGNVVVTGFPKFDQLLERGRTAPPFWPANKDGKRRFRIIWAPHHSIGDDWLGFGTFISNYQDMLNWARQAPEIEFVVKAHPHLWSKLVGMYKLMTRQQVDDYIAAWNALPNAAIVEGGDYAPLFAGSDMMLTDGISFLAEYPLFEKPLVFIDSGKHVGFNLAGAVPMECANTVSNFAAACALCEKLAKGEPDPKASARRSVLARIMPFPGQSVQKILSAIREGLEQDYDAA